MLRSCALVSMMLAFMNVRIVAADAAWPPLQTGVVGEAQVGTAAVPLPQDAPAAWTRGLTSGTVTVDGIRLQAQTVARWPNRSPRRLMVRWLGSRLPVRLQGGLAVADRADSTAGWDFAYELVAASADSVPWKTAVRNVPLEETQYEMYQVNLTHADRHLGVRLGMRRGDKLYWWQFVRADFVQRGPVFDVLRVGGPLYNEESTLQTDLYLVLYANGVVDAYVHFVNHQREGVGTSTHGIPVLAFDVPHAPDLCVQLDGSATHFNLRDCVLDLGAGAAYGSPEYPGELDVQNGLAVWQPWADQRVWGQLLVDAEGIPEHRIVRGRGEGQDLLNEQRSKADQFWVARAGEEFFPRGLARSVRFRLSLGDAPPVIRRYEAPGWWHALAGTLPTGGRLPTFWSALPHALRLAEAQYDEPHPRGGFPFEVGRSSRDSDGTLGAALLLLGHAADRPDLCRQALLPAYWWADIAINHVDYTVHELPKYSWQWIVQPYHRWLELVHAYWYTGDPYLLETARFAADSYYRFFWTNRPHRSVGRDALPVADLLALWQGTGERVYWERARDILAEARRSYEQTDDYWPGHQSGCGPNGVARQPSWDYVPMLLGRLHVQLLWTGTQLLSHAQKTEIHEFLRFVAELAAERGGTGWARRGTSLSYPVLTALAEEYPHEADRWLGLLAQRNRQQGMPGSHDGGKPFSWVTSALWLDAWTWGARWQAGKLTAEPHAALLSISDAPRSALVSTPAGPRELVLEGNQVRSRRAGAR